MNVQAMMSFLQMQRVIACKKRHEEELANNSLALQILTDIEGICHRMEDLVVEEHKNVKVASDEKKRVFDQLILEASNMQNLLHSFGNYKGFLPFKYVAGCGKTMLIRARDGEVLKRVQTMRQVMKENPAETREANISEEHMAGFDEIIARAQQVFNGPRAYRQKQRHIKLAIEDEMRHYKSLLFGSLQPHIMSYYGQSNPGLCTDFSHAIHIDRQAKRRQILSGRFTNEKGEPVSKVWVSLDGQKPELRGGETGIYFLYQVSPGQHSIVFQKKSYQKEKRVIMLEADHSMKLDIVFQLEDIVAKKEE